MWTRTAILAALCSAVAAAQFSGLHSTADGSSLYFASTLRLKGSAPLLNGKLFRVSGGDVRLARSQERAGVVGPLLCTVGGFRDYLGTETSTAATAFFYRAEALACSYPPYSLRTQLLTASGETTLPGIVRVSPNGAWAMLYAPRTARMWDGIDLTRIDLQSGARTPVSVSAPSPFIPVLVPYTGGRMVANDGTALLSFNDRGYLLKPGADPQPFPIEGGVPLAISADATKVIYRAQGTWLVDLRTNQPSLLIPEERRPLILGVSDDAGRLVYIASRQLRVIDTRTLSDRVLTNDPAGIADGAISGDGKVVWAVTADGGLLRINVDDGAAVRIIGRTPYLEPATGNATVTAGLAPIFDGSALSESRIDGAPPFNVYLDGVTMWIGERKVPLIYLAPDSLRFLVPWDTPAGSARVLAEVAGDRTPFYFPEADVTVSRSGAPVAGAIARQDWTRTYSGPVQRGEFIHVYALGLGPVSPEVPDGSAAPATEPFARITQRFDCTGAEILFAGLAPGTVERVYQVDLRILAPAGYQKFTCTLGNSSLFVFLSLNVVE